MQPDRLHPVASKASGHRGRRPESSYTPETDHYGSRGQLCVHVRSGRIEVPRFCTLRLECYHCGYDQILDELDLTATPLVKPTGGFPR